MLALRARHHDENHYSGAIWLLWRHDPRPGERLWRGYVGKLFGKHMLAPKVSRQNLGKYLSAGFATAAVIRYGYGMWANLNVARYLADLPCGGGLWLLVPGDHREYVWSAKQELRIAAT